MPGSLPPLKLLLSPRKNEGRSYPRLSPCSRCANAHSVGFHDKFVQLFIKATENVLSVMKFQAATEAWDVLKGDDFVSVPVSERNADGTKAKTVSVLNLFHFAAYFLQNMSPDATTVSDILGAVTVGHIAGNVLLNRPYNLGLSYNSPLFISEQEKITFRKMCTLLALPRCHCIFLSSEKKLVTLVPRIALVRFIAGKSIPFFGLIHQENIEHWEEYLTPTVSEVRIGAPGFFLHESATMEDAFRVIVEKTEGAIGIENEEGKLTGFLSIRALPCVTDGTKPFS